MAVQVIESLTFEEFLDELRRHPSIRVVKLADYGFVAPLNTGSGATIMAPQLRVVATAFDKQLLALMRWESARQIDSRPTVAMETIKGIHGDMRVAVKKEELKNRLELEGYSVSNGEWTGEELERLLLRQAAPA